MKTILLSLLAVFLSPAVFAEVRLGQTLPELDIPKKGELLLNDNGVSYGRWSTRQMREGIPSVVFHLAARMSADAIIKPLTNRLDAEGLDPQKHQAITIINLDDAMWGTSGIVASELEKNKKKHPEAVIVADDGSRGIAAWKLPRKSVSVMVLDRDGKLLFLHHGEISEDNINKVINLLKQEIKKIS